MFKVSMGKKEKPMLKIVLQILEDNERSISWLCRQSDISPALFTLMNKGERTITELTKDKFSQVLGIRKEILFNKENK